MECSLIGLVSLQHKHAARFGQADLYVLVKLLMGVTFFKIQAGLPLRNPLLEPRVWILEPIFGKFQGPVLAYSGPFWTF